MTTYHYRLMVAGDLTPTLCDHYGGQLTYDEPFTIYDFQVTDQTHLHGILAHLRDFNVPIVQLVWTNSNYQTDPKGLL
ncbi:MAG: hypothetical protein R3D55_12855 [Chloroflexota bacterium]